MRGITFEGTESGGLQVLLIHTATLPRLWRVDTAKEVRTGVRVECAVRRIADCVEPWAK